MRNKLSVLDLTETDLAEIVTTSGVRSGPKDSKTKGSAKTAYMVVRNGRPYFYATINKWDRRTKKVISKKLYLGKELPRGYRLKNEVAG